MKFHVIRASSWNEKPIKDAIKEVYIKKERHCAPFMGNDTEEYWYGHGFNHRNEWRAPIGTKYNIEDPVRNIYSTRWVIYLSFEQVLQLAYKEGVVISKDKNDNTNTENNFNVLKLIIYDDYIE